VTDEHELAERETEDDGTESARERQEPIERPASSTGKTWLSGDDSDDPLRKDAAERARRAVEPGEPRE
jgi:hypothetical protein